MLPLSSLDCGDWRMRGNRLTWTFLLLITLLVTLTYYGEGVQYLGSIFQGNELLEEDTTPLSSSTCNVKASERGGNQRVVSFSLYGVGSDPGLYFQGIEANYELLQKMYPGWIMRIYHDVSPSNEKVFQTLKEYERRFLNLDLCSSSTIPGYGDLQGMQENIWRFLPLIDPLVDVFISRDLDSRISERELAAVNQWLKTNLTFHVMRDHLVHSDVILAGMWGVQVAKARRTAMILMARMLVRGRKSKDKYFDQFLLRKVVWPAIKGDVLQHDSYHCMEYSSHGHMTAWPTRRLNGGYNFVGSVVPSGHEHGMFSVCPEECRPPDHKDWTIC